MGMQKGAFFGLAAFYFVYAARPADWIPLLNWAPLAKITGTLTVLAALFTAGLTPRKVKDLPREAFYLLALIAIMFISALLSPVWRGGAFFDTVDFAKVGVAWVLTFLLVTSLARFRRIVFIQAASVVVICAVAIIKGHSELRLSGVVGGIYSNPNDLALAIVLSLPFCLAFLLSAKSKVRKTAWCIGVLLMIAALFMTASRAGFIDLVVSGAVVLWHFGVKGKRFFLIAGVVLITVLSFAIFGNTVVQRFASIYKPASKAETDEALASYEDRRLAIERSFGAIERYPLLGLGANCFVTYSGLWREVHVSYLQVAAECGIPGLILYLLFFKRGFSNLKRLRRAHLDPETQLFAGALHASLVGFVVGAFFAPVAYHYFPYFTVGYTSVLVAMAAERQPAEASIVGAPSPRVAFVGIYNTSGRSRALTPSG
ncbi:MAG: O-antigen ligase family protein [Candidatus Sulfotelmatobacter sp.]